MKPIAALIAALAVFGTYQPAQAGNWVFTITGSSSFGGLSTGASAYSPPAAQSTNGIATSWSTGGSFTGQVTVTLNLNIKGTWVPDPNKPGDTPPPSQMFLETVSAACSGYAQSGATGTANDGIGDSSSYTIPTPWYGEPSINTTASGKQLTVASNGTFTSNRTLIVAISGGSGACTPSFTYSITKDARTLTLSRNSLDQTYGDASTVYGDTTYSYIVEHLLQEDDQVNWQTVNANLVGWHTKPQYNIFGQLLGYVPDVTWSWSPTESDDTVTTGKWSVPFGTLNQTSDGGFTGSLDTPTSYKLSYHVTDNVDGARATGCYQFLAHDQFDFPHPDPANPDYTQVNNYYCKVNGAYIAVGNANGQPTTGVGGMTITGTLGFKLALTGDFTLPWLKLLTKPTLEFNGSVSMAVNVGSQVLLIPNGEKEFPIAQVTYPVHNILVNEWNASGSVQKNIPQSYGDSTQEQCVLIWSNPVDMSDPSLPSQYPPYN